MTLHVSSELNAVPTQHEQLSTDSPQLYTVDTTWCHRNHSTECIDTCVWGPSTGLSLWQSVFSVANVFLVLSSISCHVLSIPEYKLLFTATLSCMAVCSPCLHNAVTFYICTFSAGNSCLIHPFCPHWTD